MMCLRVGGRVVVLVVLAGRFCACGLLVLMLLRGWLRGGRLLVLMLMLLRSRFRGCRLLVLVLLRGWLHGCRLLVLVLLRSGRERYSE